MKLRRELKPQISVGTYTHIDREVDEWTGRLDWLMDRYLLHLS